MTEVEVSRQLSQFSEVTAVLNREWVSKSDLVAYLRCPYAFWLLDTGQIRPWEALGEPAPPPPGGQERHEQRLKIAREWLLHCSAKYRRQFVLEPGVFRNPDLKIVGRPDGVRTAKGALFPVLIGSTSKVSPTDEPALAFYWLLLEPHREVKGLEPRGYVLYGWPCKKIRLRPKWFDEVLATCEAIREARRRGVNPRICDCAYCKGRPEIVRAAIEAKDLSCISGIGRQRRARLERLGVRSYADLLALDPQPGRQLGISPRTLAGWQAHARSYEDRRPVIFGGDHLELRDMLVLDIEYSSCWLDLLLPYEHIIWLIGLCTVVGGRRKYEFLWADSPVEEQRNILTLLNRIDRSDVPIVTWSGGKADLPQLRKAIKRLRIRRSCDALLARHVDVLNFLGSNVRLPIPAFGLKEVAEYFGIARRSRVADGSEAVDWYADYQKARGEEKKRLKRELLQYNRDDLNCLIEVVGRLRTLR